MPLLHSNPILSSIRPSAAELLAYVVLDLFPTVLLVGGGQSDIGFYYDFIFEHPLDDQMLDLIETRLKGLIKTGKEIKINSMMRENAAAFFNHHHQPLLAQKALESPSNIVSLFQLDQFSSLSTEKHIDSTDKIGSIKLLEQTTSTQFIPEEGAIETTRVLGTAFPEAFTLKQFLKAYDKLKKIDHRQLGPELKLFSFIEKVGLIECFWLPKGMSLLRQLEQIWHQESQRHPFDLVSTPLIVADTSITNKSALLATFTIQEKSFGLCSSHLEQHIQMFNEYLMKSTSLPYRMGEIAKVYKHIDAGQTWGLMRGYSHWSDLVTLFCSEQQVEQEIIYSLQFFQEIVKILCFEAHWVILVSDHKACKGAKYRNGMEYLIRALKRLDISYLTENQELPCNPKVEIRWADSLGRAWEGPSIEVVCAGVSREASAPVVLARRAFNSLDRVIALLIEEGKGFFPFWLAPEQVRLLVIGESPKEYAQQVWKGCREAGYRVSLDERDEKLAVKVLEAEKERIPYVVMIGEREARQGRVAVRMLPNKGQTLMWSLSELLIALQQEKIQ